MGQGALVGFEMSVRFQSSLRFWIAGRLARLASLNVYAWECSIPLPKALRVPESELPLAPSGAVSIEVSVLDDTKVSRSLVEFDSLRISVDTCILTVVLFEAAAELAFSANVYADLFRPLERPGDYGKWYAAPEQERDRRLAPHVSRHEGFRQSFIEIKPGGRVDPYRVMSIWERILPLLQPPLELDLPKTIDLPSPLWAYQVEGVKFLLDREGALLGDDMGTGKTVQATVALRILFQAGKVSSALIVCPLSVLRHWDHHLERWAPLLSPNVVRGTKERRKGIWRMPAHVWITTYDTLREDIETINEERGQDGFDVVILDEVQKIKNPKSGFSRSVKRLNSRWRWGFTGTPVENSLEDLGSIFGFLRPGLFRGLDYHTPERAKEEIRPYFLRRRKADVLKDLPEKIEYEEWLALEEDQKRAYEDAEKKGIVYLQELGEKVTVHHVLSLLTRLKQICNVDHASGQSAKGDWLRDFMEALAESEDKAVIFSQFLGSGVDWLVKEFHENKPLKYVGGMPEPQRQTALSQFKSELDRKVLFMTRAGGLGIELTSANYAVHFDHWWNPAAEKQADGRLHRPGQTKKVFVYHLWAEGTVEERIRRILERKQRLYVEVIDALSNVEGTGLSEDEIFEVFGLENPKKKRAETIGWRRKNFATPNDLQQLSPEELEELTGELYERMGYGVRRTPATRDRGIDIIATRQKTSVAGIEKVAIQCKRHEAPVGEPVARNLLGALTADPTFSKGVIVAIAGFTKECKDFCERTGRIELVDGPMLIQLLIRFTSKAE